MTDGVHRTYRSPTLLGLGVLGAVMAVLFAGWVVADEVGNGHRLAAVAAVLWGVLAALAIVEVFLRPAVATTAEGIVLVNPFRTVVVPWARVRGVETELALQIITDRGRHTSWAATGSRKASIRNRRHRTKQLAGAAQGAIGSPHAMDVLRPSDVRSMTPPLECRIFIDAGYQAWQMDRNKPADPGVLRVTWHRPWLLAVAALAVGLVAVTAAL